MARLTLPQLERHLFGAYGQEFNGGTWAIAKMNMVLHGINNAGRRNDDTLTTPKHIEPNGELTRFDRILTNPPFSQNYHQEGMRYRERFEFGWAPETGKKADLMFAQHVLAVLEDDGLGAIVMPHGILFRGGKEKEIRKEIIEADRLDAVVGLAPNLFYGTGIPACVLVLHGPGPRPADREGKVLFVNADREFTGLVPLGVLDRYQLAGVIASWWGDVQYDIRTLAYHKFSGVVQGWLTTIEAAFDTEGEEIVRNQQRLAAEKRRAREHSAVPLLIPDYLNTLEEAEAHRADLDAQVRAATAKPAEGEEDADDDVSAETSPSPEELKKLKSDLAAAKKEVKRLEADFLNQLKEKIEQLNASAEETLVRQILKADLKKRLEAEFAIGPRMLADRYRTWASKYAVPLLDLESRRSVAEARFTAYLKDLGYE